jgi:hypothetical protein
MCDLVARDCTLENRLVSREHRPGRISGTSSWTMFRVREPSRSVRGEGRSATCPYKTGFVGANPVFALERERNDVRRERPARNDVRRERPAQPLEIQSGGLES